MDLGVEPEASPEKWILRKDVKRMGEESSCSGRASELSAEQARKRGRRHSRKPESLGQAKVVITTTQGKVTPRPSHPLDLL